MEWFRINEWFTPGKSQRFLLLLAGLLVSIFAGILTTSTPVYAADATWEGAKLRYQNQDYSPVNDRAALEDLDLEDATRVYATSVPGTNATPGELKLIVFANNTDMSTATSAQHIVYDYTPPSNFTRKSTQTITTDPAGENTGGLEQGTSCNINGIGWIVCPVANYLASGMDWLYGVLTQFLVSQPLNVSDQSTGLYQAWRIMLGIANAAFIIVFIVIIYSHLTSFGVSNYGIKKLLPRLVIAAILVNVSYYICAIAIDLSNIIGQSIQDMFISIRNTMTTVGSAGGDEIPTWEVVTTFILSGGAVTAGAATFFFAYAGSIGAASIMLIPMLLGVLLTVIVVLLVLAARQALIVILTIISPLAFVCYLLPGTEKWFEKWRSTFFTMLLFFPAFSAVFGGSQLAGAAIIQNANSIVMVLLGLGVQIAPLALAPLILKLSGGLLNRFAGIVNNPAKGLLDRTRNLAKEQSQHLANKARSNPNLKKWQLRGIGQSAYHTQQRRKERIENYQKMADAAYEATDGHARLDKQRREIEHGREIVAKQLDINWNTHLKLDSKALEKDLNLRVKTDQAELATAELKTRYEAFKTGFGGDYGHAALQNQAVDLTRDVAIQGLASQSAQRVQNSILANQLDTNTNNLRDMAGRIENLYFGNNRGSQRVYASALQTVSSVDEDAIKNATTILEHGNYTDPQKAQMALGRTVPNGPTVTSDIQKAAARAIFGGKNDVDLTWALKNMDLSVMSDEMRQEIGDALLKNGDRPVWIGAKVAADIKASAPSIINLSGQSLFDNVIKTTINQNKLGSADKLLSQTPGYINEVVTALPQISGDISPEVKSEIMRQIILARQNPLYRGRIAERKEQIKSLYDTLAAHGGAATYASYDDIPDTP